MVGPSPASQASARPHEQRPPSRRCARRRPAATARWQPPKQKKRRWTPPSKRGTRRRRAAVADAAADLAREAAGVARRRRRGPAGVPRRAAARRDGRRVGHGPELRGRHVRALLPGGAAEQSGAVAPGDQLVAIDGDAVFDATFDAAMARLAAVDAEARLEFFRGDRTELLAAVGRRAAAPGAATITVDDRGERREIVVEAGAN